MVVLCTAERRRPSVCFRFLLIHFSRIKQLCQCGLETSCYSKTVGAEPKKGHYDKGHTMGFSFSFRMRGMLKGTKSVLTWRWKNLATITNCGDLPLTIWHWQVTRGWEVTQLLNFPPLSSFRLVADYAFTASWAFLSEPNSGWWDSQMHAIWLIINRMPLRITIPKLQNSTFSLLLPVLVCLKYEWLIKCPTSMVDCPSQLLSM